MNQKPKIILDVDTGSDDAIAIMMAELASPLDLVAVCTTWNQPIENTTDNTLRVLQLVESRVPVYKGAPTAMVKYLSPLRARGGRTNPKFFKNGKTVQLHQDFTNLPKSNKKIEKEDASSFYVEYLNTTETPITLVLCGPMTNFALALTMDPAIVRNIKEIVIMGGGYATSNVTLSAESNVWRDPEAAEKTINCGAKITLIPLDATHQALLSKQDCTRLRDIGTPASIFATEMIEHRIEVYDQTQPLHGKGVAPIHDALCIAYLIDKSVLLNVRHCHCEVDCSDGPGQGTTLIDNRVRAEPPNINLALGADKDLFLELLEIVLNNTHRGLS